MKSLTSLRAVLVTGKGGVGKTTVAAALARYIASTGRRVLAAEMSADGVASSALASAIGVDEITEDAVQIDEYLSAMRLSPSRGHHQFLRDVLPMKVIADSAMRSNVIRKFLAAAPTFPEMGVLYRLLDLSRKKLKNGEFAHETIIVDLPATGHALALAQIPQSLLNVIPSGPIAVAVREGLGLLLDPEQTGALVVTLPEALPVSESIELLAGIHTHNIPLAGVIVNRVPHDPFTREECREVEALVKGLPPMLGVRSLERVIRARESIARLRENVDTAPTLLPELFADGAALAKEIALRIEAAEAGKNKSS